MDALIYAFVFWLGWRIRGALMMFAMRDNPEKIIDLLKQVKEINDKEEKKSDIRVEVEPEKVGNVWYAYAKDTGQFLAQADTLEEAIRQASIRFPNKTFWCETDKKNLTNLLDLNNNS